MSEIELAALDRRQALDALDEVADLYEQVYAEPPYNAAPKFSRDRFTRRTHDQATASGFAMVTARRGGTLVGFAFGFSMMPGAWWANAASPAGEVLKADKFAVVELVVDRWHRRHGIGGRLLDALLADRRERYATLAAVIEADAYGWYLRRGWQKVAEFRAEPPYSDALVLPLASARTAGDA
ncbi:GNAT family N-acetyltransferase [Actinomadura macrotermitis]|uniref:N-acetyltransferase domain-containing protein n=1 Tax=Actinomadura macrotermitis TaxID=2585200 RepID=A0A7K0BSK7_9ACTN|nr:GNAT family N-acetyltransferase [Actinomadura macrotermitis]MQY04141.1 hypothetical protein [Actinomadura macrotermitis]